MKSSTLGIHELPRFFLHGFIPQEESSASQQTIQQYIKSLPPLYQRDETTDYANIGGGELFSDLGSDIELTKFTTNCLWETSTSYPYANATIQLKMPSALVPFLFHGQPMPNQKYASVFRHTEAGGWMSLRFPTVTPEEPLNKYATVFFGKITNLSVVTQKKANNVLDTSVTVTAASFIYPYIIGETRKTPLRKDGIAKIDPAAIGSYSTKDNEILKEYFSSARADSDGEYPLYPALRSIIESLGHFSLPTSVTGVPSTPAKSHRLGDAILVLGDHGKDTSGGTIYEKQGRKMDTVKGRVKEQYWTAAFQSNRSSMWTLIQSLFQPDPDLIELFPVLLPYRYASQIGEGSEGVSALSGNLGSIPYLVYRHKPLPPHFDASGDDVDNLHHSHGRLLKADSTFHEEFFGTDKSVATTYKPTDPADLLTRETTKEETDFVIIPSTSVISQSLTWTDAERINGVNFSLPYAQGATGDALLFGVECVPVFNQEDINRHGLRMHNRPTPFVGEKGEGEQKKYNNLASSAYAERTYYLLGEGHAYARGEITLTYTPNPNLIAGVWCVILDEVSLFTTLSFYVTAVKHDVLVDPSTGQPKGKTVLIIERASYASRIPVIRHKQVTKQSPDSASTPSTTKTTKKKPTRVRKQ